jgi:hypothetical protein
MKRLFLAFFAVILPISLMAFTDQADSKAGMHGDLDVIKNIFKTQYAPIEWKGSYAGWNLDEQIQYAKDQVTANPEITIKDYQTILKNFFNSVLDYHVKVSFYSTECAELPFTMKSAGDRYFISAIDRSRIPKSASKIQVGDEILSFDGIWIAQAVHDFQMEEFSGREIGAEKVLAEIFFTLRIGAHGFFVPSGNGSLTVKHTTGGKIASYTLPWEYEPELIQNIVPKRAVANFAASLVFHSPKETALPLNTHKIFKKRMITPYYDTLVEASHRMGDTGIGARQSFLPSLGKKTWQTAAQSPFNAYIFETQDKHRYGYIRIPHYDGSEEDAAQFKSIIKKFKAETEALVIDQLHNPGGSVFYMYALASMLTDKPLKVPTHRLSITQKEVVDALELIPLLGSISSDEDAEEVLGETLEGLFVDHKLARKFRKYFEFTVAEWNAGRTFTSPVPLFCLDEIAPAHEVRYTKPILVLINELDFSCGDFFPAILQDNQRATLFGARTAGAGGCVLMTEYPNLFGISRLSYTGSIAERIDNNPIENLGVTPDIKYELTEEDLRGGYAPYISAVLKALKGL